MGHTPCCMLHAAYCCIHAVCCRCLTCQSHDKSIFDIMRIGVSAFTLLQQVGCTIACGQSLQDSLHELPCGKSPQPAVVVLFLFAVLPCLVVRVTQPLKSLE